MDSMTNYLAPISSEADNAQHGKPRKRRRRNRWDLRDQACNTDPDDEQTHLEQVMAEIDRLQRQVSDLRRAASDREAIPEHWGRRGSVIDPVVTVRRTLR